MTHPVLLHPYLLRAHPQVPEIVRRLGRIPAWLMLACASCPVLVWFVKRIDDGSDEPLGLFVLGLALALASRDRASMQTGARAATCGALAVLASVLSIGILPPLLRAALAIAGAGTWFGIHRKSGLMGLLILSLPVVASLQFYAGYPMRLAAAEGAVRLMESGGVVVARNGVNLSLGGASIGVDPACSGIRMLWIALVAAMALAAIHRVSWRTTIAMGMLAVLLVIPANILRASWLALEESGRFHGIGLSHGNIGLVCFAVVLIPLWILVSKRARPASPAAVNPPAGSVARSILLASALLAPLMMGRSSTAPDATIPLTAVPETFTFNGLTLPLHPLPASREEAAFATSFPGTLSSHRWGNDQVILRRVNRATRKLHPSADCLRAAGYATSDSVTVQCAEGSQWSRFSATRDGIRLTIHERVVSETDGSAWTDVSAWYWSALRRPLNGPWRAETVISR